jgi:hypothetical protein
VSVVCLCILKHVKIDFTRNDRVLRLCFGHSPHRRVRRPMNRDGRATRPIILCDTYSLFTVVIRRRSLRGRIRSTIRVLGPGIVCMSSGGLTFVLISLLILYSARGTKRGTIGRRLFAKRVQVGNETHSFLFQEEAKASERNTEFSRREGRDRKRKVR